MNTENNEEQKITEGTQLPGDVLRQAREQLGYSQKDIANRLRLRLSVIDNIENNRFDQAQLATFTRGYVRSYAKYVGLEEEAVLDLLDKCGHTKPKAQEMQSFSRRTKREAHDSRIMGLTWILAAVFVGVTAVWWWQNIHLEQAPVATTTTADQTVAHEKQEQGSDDTIVTTLNGDDASISATQPATVDTDVDHSAPTSTEQNTAASTTSADAATDSSPTTASTTATGTTTEASTTPAENAETASTSVSTATATPVVDATAPQLQLKFSADCWIDVRDATGKRLESGIKKAGQVLDLEGKAPFRVRLGAPSAVKINIKGQPFDLSRYPGSKPVTLKLPQ
ncbi:cytoskeleton protein RodZ [Photobacterium angustum]|uniref:cytoskeleton protein RodZ n=1 Tax=Photobacterium angustum TaxID=661 RepID=UPI0005E5E648|nr:cytoskeleton protein RodZ [Photobacterium angustum]KJG18110.1 XRE family transcriptional regulator [Photobacterium angustum]KJG26202.1 XRE family transcriptional regulator [Photobacterium angustum]KJG32213.1 XRE family transcriptional regulator [Photobacterium angustum]PSW93621.1 cytoskeleton protein RodZ [Photobacterium angustum]PSX02346.1 cytoskeleton protein RodZ [Photobacterium angustum]